jgi:hypothetical protein
MVSDLVKNINLTIKKIHLLSSQDLSKVQGDWCKGCTANCEFRKESKSNSKAKLEFDEFYSNVTAVVDETIKVLRDEMKNILEKEHINIKDDCKSNIDGKEEAFNTAMSDTEKRNDERGVKNLLNIKDLIPGKNKVNVKGKIDRIMHPRYIKNGNEKVVEAEISDSTGKINLALFNGQSENVKVGDEVYVGNGYTKEFSSVTTLYIGQYGKLTIL